jgi:hypothetical protein
MPLLTIHIFTCALANIVTKIHIQLAFMRHKPMVLRNHFGLQQKQTHIYLVLSIT